LPLTTLIGAFDTNERKDQLGRAGQHGWLRWQAPSAVPTDKMTELTIGLAGRTPSFMGHDSIDQHNAVRKIKQAAGLPEDWGTCEACGGEGTSPASRAAYEAWEPTAPPTGPGWQLWENVSEGSPISPVFTTPEELATWMSRDDEPVLYEQALRFIYIGTFFLAGSTDTSDHQPSFGLGYFQPSCTPVESMIIDGTCKRCRNERPVRKVRVVKQKKAPVVLPTPPKKKKGRS